MTEFDPDRYLGKKITLRNGDLLEWTGVAAAYSEVPSVLVEIEGGHRVMLPARFIEEIHEPWRDAKPDEVWMLTVNSRKALVWKDTGPTFTIVPPNGQSHICVSDVIAELVEIGYTEFNSPDLKAVRLKEEE